MKNLAISLVLLGSLVSHADSNVVLSDGKVNYELAGETGHPLVVLVHGVSGPMMVWDKTVEALNEAGFQTLRYDLYGRGGSDRINSTYGLDLYLRQLSDLLDVLKIHQPITLVGSSMGAIISTAFTLAHPDKVTKLVLIGPGGFPLSTPPTSKLLNNPTVDPMVIQMIAERVILEQNRNYFYEPENFTDYLEKFKVQLAVKGSIDAILQTTRNVPLQDFIDEYEKLNKRQQQVLILWGKEDVSFPYSYHSVLTEALPRADFIAIPRAAHLPQYEQADMVNLSLIQFLNR